LSGSLFILQSGWQIKIEEGLRDIAAAAAAAATTEEHCDKQHLPLLSSGRLQNCT